VLNKIRSKWAAFEEKHQGSAQFVMFFILSNGVTALQLILMPLFRNIFNGTSLVETSFQVLPVGTGADGVSPFYIFDYASGALPEGGGGLAYFLAVQITLAIAQIINFFAQRNVTFKSNTSVAKAAIWYFIAYVLITFAAAALQGFYKAPIYHLFMETWGMGTTGGTIADVITMIINSALSVWIFFPIFKVIFKRVPENETEELTA
jgi:putative flippase GtrA